MRNGRKKIRIYPHKIFFLFHGTTSATYDAAGNLLTRSDARSIVETHTWDALNRPLTVSYPTAGETLTYTWDSGSGCSNGIGRLCQVSDGGGTTTFAYDPRGNLSSQTRTESGINYSTQYTYDGADRIATLTAPTGSPIVTYVWRDDTPVSLIVAGSPETALYLETDHLGTPIAARDQQGKVVWKWESDAFGTTLANEDPDGDTKKVTINLRFPGQYFDKESGLHYNWRRYYDPKLGRYLSSDPIGLAGGGNTFGYVGGNPLIYVDPSGEIAFIPIVVGVGIGLAFYYALSKWKEEHCKCENASTFAGAAGNAAAGGAVGGSGPFSSKPRGGIAGGGPSGTATSSFSQMNHAAASRGLYSQATRHGITKVLRKVPYAGSALAAYEIYDAFSCD